MEQLLSAGMDVARLNFSHGTHETHAENILKLREISNRMGRPLAILQDLSGPKVRLGTFPVTSVSLIRGETVGLTSVLGITDEWSSQPGSFPLLLPLPNEALLRALKVGDRLLIDDGKIELKATRCEETERGRIIWTKCLCGGDLKPLKGVSAPGVAFEVPAVTEKDVLDLRFGLAQGVDWIAVSYVRRKEDLELIKAVMREVGVNVPLIAKIEKFEAVKNFDSILESVDAIMVARGDLGVETPYDEVPMVQKRIIRACNLAGNPVITATQMLESMMSNSRPTRAEAADVANAILDGSDAVMLSGETAAGQFPVQAARTMAQIALKADEALAKSGAEYQNRLAKPVNVTQAIARATSDIACELKAKAILCATTTGNTANAVATYRPSIPILAFTVEKSTYHRLALTWGVTPYLIPQVEDTDTMMRTTILAAQKSRRIKDGDLVVLTAGVPVNHPGTTNLIQAHIVGKSKLPG